MSVTTEEQRYCEGCGDAVATRDTEGHGPCCHNLPNPWHRGRDGLYNQTSESEDFEDEDVEPSPHCEDCGSTEWRLRAEQRVTSRAGDRDTIRYDLCEFSVTARCAECGTRMPSYYDLESE